MAGSRMPAPSPPQPAGESENLPKLANSGSTARSAPAWREEDINKAQEALAGSQLSGLQQWCPAKGILQLVPLEAGH